MEYIGQLFRHIDGYVVVLWDGLPAHKSNAVKGFGAQHGERLSIYRLPAYCPDFNPMKWLWADVKWNRMKGFCPKNIPELKEKLRNCVNELRRRPGLVRSFFSASSRPMGPFEGRKLCNYQ